MEGTREHAILGQVLGGNGRLAEDLNGRRGTGACRGSGAGLWIPVDNTSENAF